VEEIDRLFSDDIYCMHASHRCSEYFARTHAKGPVLEQFSGLLTDLWGRGNGE
jgi:hypothetical protein